MSNRVATKLRILEVVMAVRFLVAYCLPDSAVVCFPCIETVAEANAGWLFLCFFSLIEHETKEIYHLILKIQLPQVEYLIDIQVLSSFCVDRKKKQERTANTLRPTITPPLVVADMRSGF